MIDPSTAQAVYNDMGALADLRGRARANPNEAVEEVAQQFEALFIQMMLKSMRDAVEDGGLFGSDQLIPTSKWPISRQRLIWLLRVALA